MLKNKKISNTIKSAMLLGAMSVGGLFISNVSAHADSISQYTVQSGDTLWSIAQKEGVSLQALMSANNKSQTNTMIYVGNSLNIPTTNTKNVTNYAYSTKQTIKSTPTIKYHNTIQTAPKKVYGASTQNHTAAQTTSVTKIKVKTAKASKPATYTGTSSAAKNIIAKRESGDSYTAQNGNYYGKYQLSRSYLKGDYSAANQERVADNYVKGRYGSWEKALSFWNANGWY